MAINQQVLALQRQLLAAGFNPGPLDGVMGPKTRAAQAAFQAKQAQQPPAQAPVAPAAPAAPAAVPAAPVAPTPPVQDASGIYQDPAYLAFVRGADYSLEEAARQTARRQNALNTALALRMPEIQQQGEQQRQGISNSYEARGLHRSGKRIVDQGLQEQQQAKDIATAQSSTAEQLASEQESLAGRVAEVQRQAGEKGYGVAGQQDLDKRMEGLRAKYPAQFGAKA